MTTYTREEILKRISQLAKEKAETGYEWMKSHDYDLDYVDTKKLEMSDPFCCVLGQSDLGEEYNEALDRIAADNGISISTPELEQWAYEHGFNLPPFSECYLDKELGMEDRDSYFPMHTQYMYRLGNAWIHLLEADRKGL